MNAVVERARTFLFVPGHRPDRFAKGVAAGADAVVIDLEDAVPAEAKAQARADVLRWSSARREERATGVSRPSADGLDTPGARASREAPALDQRPQILVRINGADTEWYADDVAALGDLDVLAGLVLPMAEPGPALTALAAGPLPVVALVETAVGVLDARSIAATPGVCRLALGSFDLASELGVDPTDQLALTATRSALVLASAAAGLPGPVDGVRAGIKDEEGLREETALARRIGFTGKLCIHPAQVGPVADVLAPGEAEVAWARRIVAAVAEAGTEVSGGVVTVDGQMVDKPVLDRARGILAVTPTEENEE